MTDEITRWAIQVVANGEKATPPVFTPNDMDVTWYKDTALTQAWDFENDTVTNDIKLYATRYASVLTAPTAASNLEYNKNPQALVTAGSAENGTMMYSLNNVDYSADVPTATNAGDYTVYYKVVGNGGYSDVAPTSIPVKIERANVVEITPNPIKATVLFGSPLSAATFTEGKFYAVDATEVLEGTFAFADPTKVITQDNALESCIFTPTNTNYKPKNTWATVSFSYSGGGSGVTSIIKHTVTFDTDGGSEVESQKVIKDRRIEMPENPTKAGYTFDGWYTDKSYKKEFTAYSKVTKDITLYAKWIQNGSQSEDPVEDEPQGGKDDVDNKPEDNKTKNPFNDVSENDWFYENVIYAVKNGLMSGVTANIFAPTTPVTRAMFVAVLYRAEGEPEVINKSIPFADVSADSYYANAVIWAHQNGIVSGVTENEFAPDENITREQIAAVLYRYARYKGCDVTQGGMQIREFEDYESISEYALTAMTWAVNSGLLKGKTEFTLNPKDLATRAEVAAILQRFIEMNK